MYKKNKKIKKRTHINSTFYFLVDSREINKNTVFKRVNKNIESEKNYTII